MTSQVNGSKRGGGGSRVSDLIIRIYVHTRKGVSFFHYLRTREERWNWIRRGWEKGRVQEQREQKPAQGV